MKRKNVSVLFLGMSLILTFLISCAQEKEPIIITESASHRQLTIDEKIIEAELIVIGRVQEVLPSRWDSVDGKGPEIVTSKIILEEDLSIFTDTLIVLEQILKGSFDQSVLRVRSYSGQIDQVQWIDKSQASYQDGKAYLLFLKMNTGPTANIDPGAYMSINGISAIYAISENSVTSIDDKWVLEELVAHIQKIVAETK